MRLFIAVNLPVALRQELWEAAEPLRRGAFPVKWVAADALHLTLKFLGDVAPEREAELLAGMEQAAGGAKPFALHLAGFGVFPSISRPRVIWAGCDAPAPLELLQHGHHSVVVGEVPEARLHGAADILTLKEIGANYGG